LKENAYKISARIRRTENIQLYLTSTMEELFAGWHQTGRKEQTHAFWAS